SRSWAATAEADTTRASTRAETRMDVIPNEVCVISDNRAPGKVEPEALHRQLFSMRLIRIALLGTALAAPLGSASAQSSCGTAGLTLPQGFCATLVADSLPGPRQMDVAPNGDLFVALRGRPARDSQPAVPGGVLVLRFQRNQ